MNLPAGYELIRKELKHARLRVSEDGSVRVLVPFTFTEDDIAALLEKKARWVEQGHRFFSEKSRIELHRNQLLLYGNRYAYFYDDTYERRVQIDHQHRTIRAKRNLLNLATQERWYKVIARKHLLSRTEELAARLKLEYQTLYVRSQRKKWGNCSTDKNISLNWRLIKAPLFVIDYLIVHELVHTLVMNHTAKYWTLLKSYYPDYKDAISWLDKYGNSL